VFAEDFGGFWDASHPSNPPISSERSVLSVPNNKFRRPAINASKYEPLASTGNRHVQVVHLSISLTLSFSFRLYDVLMRNI